MSYQVQVRASDGEWVQAGPDSIATREEAEAERARQVACGADANGLVHNGSRIVSFREVVLVDTIRWSP